ncbi:MAG TPA: citrate/2-methylcitrate synthase [Candidatus Borkfalkia excrementavium]|uniref:Citrate synthase n=1 Tax=Candidatus Borkfalkia excrementavium TaxID=2838505 RepID=A0A9D1Z7A0_9FIRM|nr:citrate/2-methylcitrate synthase [Candidatus Borkfalkia excrementavium]
MNYSELRDHLLTNLSKYAQDIMEMTKMAQKSDIINPKLYEKYDVKRGLRDINGNGVVCGLTEISEIVAFGKDADGNKIPADGQLYYRGIDIRELVKGEQGRRFDFEEATYLLLFGHLPTKSQLERFCEILADFRTLPPSFVRDIIMKAPSRDMMNMLARCVLSLYSYDPKPDDVSKKNVLRQSLQLIAQFPLLTVYSQKAYQYYHSDASLFIHKPRKELSTAENILHILREDSKYTELEAEVLDLCLVLHAEHGGGNNSTFTTHVVTSSGTDTYSSVAASLGSLKGPKHGGANIKVCEMFDNIKAHVPDYDRGKLKDYIAKILDREAYDRSGLVYGMGHAVYSLSDPRADILKSFAEKLAVEKHMEKEYEMRTAVAEIAAELIAEKRKIYKGVSPNVDFFSGFVYDMLNLPRELYTPFFAVSRIAGWSAHRMEEITNGGKIIRPGYQAVAPRRKYVPIEERTEEE